MEHIPVMCAQAVSSLAVRADGVYVDATFGRGGHSRAILAQLGAAGRLFALDRDPEAVAAAEDLCDRRFSICRSRFSALEECCGHWGISGAVDGVLFDLGVSSPQLDDARRGFSFMRDGPLDMRMGAEGPDAADLVNQAGADELERIFREYGEERYAGRVARAVIRAREREPLKSTAELAAVIAAAVPGRGDGKHKATRCFQALRIAVNDELGELRAALNGAMKVLRSGGRLVVISFHSLEDRIVKNFISGTTRNGRPPEGLPLTEAQIRSLCLTTATMEKVAGPVRADPRETAVNVRARSAVLRVAARL